MYKIVAVKDHPILGTCRISRHRLVMTEKLGRKLLRSEHVHHKDDDKSNDDPDNLEIKTPGDHARHHLVGKPRPQHVRDKIRNAQKGREVPQERKDKMSKAHMGEVWSEERRRNHKRAMEICFKLKPRPAPTGRPWLKLGISRKTWYRKYYRKGEPHESQSRD